MRIKFVFDRMLRPLVLVALIALSATPLFAQATAIEPCPAATPTPKPGVVKRAAPVKVNVSSSQSEINSSIADDSDVVKALAQYTDKVHALSVVIGRLEGDLKKSGVGAGNLGQFVTNAMMTTAKQKSGRNIQLAIMNAGGLRKNDIASGELRASDIFELLPFENTLITVDLNGAQLSKLMQAFLRDAQAGAKLQFRYGEQNRTELIEAKLIDESGRPFEIDKNATYTITTIDYLYNLKSGTYALLHEGTNFKALGITLRDAVMAYVKAETAAGRSIKSKPDERYVQIGPGPKQETEPND